MEDLLEDAYYIGIHPSEFWEMTYAEFLSCNRAYVRKKEDEYENLAHFFFTNAKVISGNKKLQKKHFWEKRAGGPKRLDSPKDFKAEADRIKKRFEEEW